nr:N-myristoyltransferase [Cryptomonas curvata]
MKYIKSSKLLLENNEKFCSILPYNIEWIDLDFLKLSNTNEVFSFLDSNYIEDSESMFRFHYIHEFIALGLKAPGWSPFLNIALKYKRGRKLIGLITSIPKEIIINNNLLCAPDINFLCLSKKIRNKRFVGIVIQEIRRRLNLTGITKAIYTTGLKLHKSMFSCNYYHYPINSHKLMTLGFLSRINRKKYKLIKQKNNQLSEKQNETNYKLIRKKNFPFKTYRYFKTIDFLYWFRTLPGVIYLINLNQLNSIFNQEIFTFYSLPSKFITNQKNIFLYGIYSYYKTGVFLNDDIFLLIIEIIKKVGFDIINILECEKNKKKLSRINFNKGTGKLNYHIFNYKNQRIKSDENRLEFF